MYLYQLNVSPDELTAIIKGLNHLNEPDAKTALTKATALAVFADHNERAEIANEAYHAIYADENTRIWEMT